MMMMMMMIVSTTHHFQDAIDDKIEYSFVALKKSLE